MTTKPITTRLPHWMDQEIRDYWRRQGQRPSPGYRRVIEEWWTTQNLPLIEFRDGVSGRRAGIRGGPDVWEVVLVARDCGRDVGALEQHYGEHLSREAIEQALRYEQQFPNEMDAWLQENERVETVLRSQKG